MKILFWTFLVLLLGWSADAKPTPTFGDGDLLGLGLGGGLGFYPSYYGGYGGYGKKWEFQGSIVDLLIKFYF